MRELNLPLDPQNMPTTFIERLAQARDRIDCLDQFRLQNAIAGSPPAFQQIIDLLPSLIHFNRPDMIGYVGNAPAGICQFGEADTLSAPVFDGLYAMGSIGSITQTSYSDLDLWLCHSAELSENACFLMHQKLHLIQQWANELGVELNFYLMNPNEFKAKKYHSEVTEEHNGSAQHFFLLDEFYRSAVRLAGKRILWLHLDKGNQKYTDVIRQSVEQGWLNLDEWIDFGDFSELSIGEYFGASLWQLYKGIESPYKSAIKILLLESYAETYPKTDLISKHFKKLLLWEQSVSYHFDPYLAMLEQVTAYLVNRKEWLRLNRLRSCFYIKANDGQNDPQRKQALQALVKEWGWSEQDVQCLNNRANWKIKQAMLQQQMLVEQLLQSYRNLIHFARKFQIDPSIMPQDTDILMRKLYSVFEVVPGKIPLINEKIATNLAEEHITFVEVNEGVSTKPGWYMVNHAPSSLYDARLRHVQYHKNVIKSVAWAYFNGVLNVGTHLHLASQTLRLDKLRRFITDLRLSFPAKAPKVQREEMYHPNEIRHLVVAVNLVKDPTQSLPKHKLENAQLDLFNLGSSEQGLIGSISIIYRNMWNEILTQHFEGNDAILKGLKFISNKIYRNAAPPQAVNVFCYSDYLSNTLQKSVKDLVERCITVQIGLIFQKEQIQTVKIADRKWQLIFSKNKGLTEIVQENGTDKDNPSVSRQKTYVANATIPKAIANFASEGFVQFFFEDNADESFNVYVLDKTNQAECYYYCTGSKSTKIAKISRLYADNFSDTADAFGSFNFPQFYRLVKHNGDISILPFKINEKQLYPL